MITHVAKYSPPKFACLGHNSPDFSRCVLSEPAASSDWRKISSGRGSGISRIRVIQVRHTHRAWRHFTPVDYTGHRAHGLKVQDVGRTTTMRKLVSLKEFPGWHDAYQFETKKYWRANSAIRSRAVLRLTEEEYDCSSEVCPWREIWLPCAPCLAAQCMLNMTDSQSNPVGCAVIGLRPYLRHKYTRLLYQCSTEYPFLVLVQRSWRENSKSNAVSPEKQTW